MAKTIHLNYNGLPYCGTKSKLPKVIGDAEKGACSYEVTCKRCRKKAGKNGLRVGNPDFVQKESTEKEQSTKGDTKNSFDRLDMSKYDKDPEWISIKDELPPETIDKISTVECLFGIEDHEDIAVIALQHIHHDIGTLGFSRVTHWKYRK